MPHKYRNKWSTRRPLLKAFTPAGSTISWLTSAHTHTLTLSYTRTCLVIWAICCFALIIAMCWQWRATFGTVSLIKHSAKQFRCDTAWQCWLSGKILHFACKYCTQISAKLTISLHFRLEALYAFWNILTALSKHSLSINQNVVKCRTEFG